MRFNSPIFAGPPTRAIKLDFFVQFILDINIHNFAAIVKSLLLVSVLAVATTLN